MIFLDESGRRWKRVKHSALGMTLVGSLPVIALIGGSLVYDPQWGSLPSLRQVAESINPLLTAPKLDTPTPDTSKLALNTPIANATKAASGTTYQPISASPVADATPALAPSVSNTPIDPTTAPAQPQPSSPSGSDPEQNDFGRSHQPIR